MTPPPPLSNCMMASRRDRAPAATTGLPGLLLWAGVTCAPVPWGSWGSGVSGAGACAACVAMATASVPAVLEAMEVLDPDPTMAPDRLTWNRPWFATGVGGSAVSSRLAASPSGLGVLPVRAGEDMVHATTARTVQSRACQWQT